MKKFLMMVLMMFAMNANALNINPKTNLVRLNGNIYVPNVSKIQVGSQEEKQILQRTTELIKLDKQINYTYHQKPDYVPFDQLHDHYGKIMKGSDELALYFLNNKYTMKTLEQYKVFETHFLKHLEDNIKMAKERGLPKNRVKIMEDILSNNLEKSKVFKVFIEQSLSL